MRLLKGLPAKQVADDLNIDHSTYSRMERGETKLREERIEAVLKVLGVSRQAVENIESISFSNEDLFKANRMELFKLFQEQLRWNIIVKNELLEVLLKKVK